MFGKVLLVRGPNSLAEGRGLRSQERDSGAPAPVAEETLISREQLTQLRALAFIATYLGRRLT